MSTPSYIQYLCVFRCVLNFSSFDSDCLCNKGSQTGNFSTDEMEGTIYHAGLIYVLMLVLCVGANNETKMEMRAIRTS